MNIDTLWKICVFIFSAGIFVAVVRQMKRDQNGMGAGQRRDRDVASFRFLTQVVTTLVNEDDKAMRLEQGKMFLEAGKPR